MEFFVFILIISVILGILLIKFVKPNSYEDLISAIELKSQTIGELEEQTRELIAKCQDLSAEIINLNSALQAEKENNQKIVSQQKSSEVRLAGILEQTSPILAMLDQHNLKELRWLGSPIDMVAFDFEQDPKITFIEFKSGNSKESKRQKIIKNVIKMGRVYYEQVRINEKGCKIKVEQNI